VKKTKDTGWSTIKHVNGILGGYWEQRREWEVEEAFLGTFSKFYTLIVTASSQSAANGADWEVQIDGWNEKHGGSDSFEAARKAAEKHSS
jgi:hypothetical protein